MSDPAHGLAASFVEIKEARISTRGQVAHDILHRLSCVGVRALLPFGQYLPQRMILAAKIHPSTLGCLTSALVTSTTLSMWVDKVHSQATTGITRVGLVEPADESGSLAASDNISNERARDTPLRLRR